MNAANHNAQEGAEQSQKQTETNANTEPVNQASQHIATVAVGTKPMPCTRRKRRCSLFTQVSLKRVVRNRRHYRPNFGTATRTGKTIGGIFFAFAHRFKKLAIIGFGLVFSAKVRIAIAHKSREKGLSLVAHQERFIVNSPGARERQ